MEFIQSISSKESEQINTQMCPKDIETPKRKVQSWTKKQDNQLMELYQRFPKKWAKISSLMDNRNQNQCLHRYLRLNKADTYSKVWSTAEDELTLKLIKEYGKNWKIISQKMGTKSGKQIKDRFINKLDPQIEIKSKEESCLMEEKQHKLGGKLLSKSSSQFKDRLGYSENIYSSQKILPKMVDPTQFKPKFCKESVTISRIKSEQKFVFIGSPQIQYSAKREKIRKDDNQQNFNERSPLIISSTLRMQDMSENDSCVFFSRQYE